MSCLAEAGSRVHGSEVRSTVVLTLSFQAVFTAFNALQNLHSSVHDEGRLGLVSLTILYFTSALSSIIAPTVISHLGARTVIVIFFMFHCVYVGVNFYPTFATMIPAAVLVGALFGPAWTAQGLYIAANADSYSARQQTSPFVVLRRFSWCFFVGLASSQVLGNLLTSVVLYHREFNQTDNYQVKYCGVYDCHTNENFTKLEDPHGTTLSIILSVYLACTATGVLLVISLLPPLPKLDWVTVSLRQSIVSYCRAVLNVDMLLLIPFILYSTMQNAFLIGTFTSSYISCPLGLYMVGYVMAAYGLTTPVLSLLMDAAVKITGRFLCILLAMGTQVGMLILLYFWAPDESDIAFIFLFPVVWGMTECIIITQANSLITAISQTRPDHLFACYHTWRGLGLCVTFLCSTYLCVSTTIVLVLSMAILAMIFYVVVELKIEIKQHITCKQIEQAISRSSTEDDLDKETQQAIQNISVASPLMSLQERWVLDHPELNDVIKEAQMNWLREGSNPTLDVKRAMSQRHLQDSKAMLLYHSRLIASVGCLQAIPRSFSDSHVINTTTVCSEVSKLSTDGDWDCQDNVDSIAVAGAGNDGTKEPLMSLGENSDSHSSKIFQIGDGLDDDDEYSYIVEELKKLPDVNQTHDHPHFNQLNFEISVDPSLCSNSSAGMVQSAHSNTQHKSICAIGLTNRRNGYEFPINGLHVTHVDHGYVSDDIEIFEKVQIRGSDKRRWRRTFKSVASTISAGLRMSRRQRISSHRSDSFRSRSSADSDGFVNEDSIISDEYLPRKHHSSKYPAQTKEDSISIY